MTKIVVTGASGYIGGQIALQLKDSGYEVYGVDLRACPRHLQDVFKGFSNNNFADQYCIEWMLQLEPHAIIHCAGTSLVGPSIESPQIYYNNNVVKTLKLLDAIIAQVNRPRFIFSSSAAVYGTPLMTPVHEVDPKEPISPYGESKLMVEHILAAYRRAYNLDYVAFRYFNACGADTQARHGQEPGATHIIARVLESIRDCHEFYLYGNTFNTPDGTCVRDYVHVDDIARAHIIALDNIIIRSGVYNIGSTSGTTNREIIHMAEKITGAKVDVIAAPARPGDPDVLTASSEKILGECAWQPVYTLEDIIQHAWAWYQRQT
jgi:UDP-glucose 4-epimerase